MRQEELYDVIRSPLDNREIDHGLGKHQVVFKVRDERDEARDQGSR